MVSRVVHFVYPHDVNKIAPPWSIGNNVAHRLRARNYDVKQYDWESTETIVPRPGDVLLGHPHPSYGHVFRNSLAGAWSKRVALCPLPVPGESARTILNAVEACDYWLAIGGPRWNYLLAHWGVEQKAKLVDMAIAREDFPPLAKHVLSSSGFLFIGCTLSMKNAGLFSRLSCVLPQYRFAHAGPGVVGGKVLELGNGDLSLPASRAALSQYDFLVMCSTFDANPTTVLEALCWGLIPVCTPYCGWDFPHMLPFDVESAAGVLNYLASTDKYWRNAQKAINRRLAQQYNWSRFVNAVEAAIN